jgi:hypothetical protein
MPTSRPRLALKNGTWFLSMPDEILDFGFWISKP